MKIFIDRPVATLMVYLALLSLGIYSLFHLPIELAPQEDYPQVDIAASWPGASPEIMQTQVTALLEETALSVNGVRKITSTSDIGVSRITLEFDPRINLEFANLALREALGRVQPQLPYGVKPVVEPYVPEDFSRPTFSDLHHLGQLSAANTQRNGQGQAGKQPGRSPRCIQS
jgi:HAE1 family hydrophobic/amphiphilic exporter-1